MAGRAVHAAAPGADVRHVLRQGQAELGLVPQVSIRPGPVTPLGVPFTRFHVENQNAVGQRSQPQAFLRVGRHDGDRRAVLARLGQFDPAGCSRCRVQRDQAHPGSHPQGSAAAFVQRKNVVHFGGAAGQRRQVVA